MTFPLDLPADLENAEALRAHDWQAFSQVDFMQNHWDRPGWVEGRRSYHWMLSFHEDPVVQDLANRCHVELVRPDFDPVPLDALHLTIGRVAFADETAQDTVDRLVEIAKVKCKKLPPFGLEVGPLAGSRGAIRSRSHRGLPCWSCIARWRRRLRTCSMTWIACRPRTFGRT